MKSTFEVEVDRCFAKLKFVFCDLRRLVCCHFTFILEIESRSDSFLSCCYLNF